MKEVMLIVGGAYGGLAVLLGAFGAHYLKNRFSEEQLNSFETGVKYQMYHAILMVSLGHVLSFENFSERVMAWCFAIGIFLFSFSIYGLCISGAKGNKWRFLGPVTPFGGLLLLFGWILLTYNALYYI